LPKKYTQEMLLYLEGVKTMVSKFLEKQVEVEYDGLQQRSENAIELDYYLLESEYSEIGDMETQKGYGVEIVKKHKGILNEKKHFENIFSTREKTKNLIDLLAKNTVTPSSLPYILDDLLGV
jgi:hypothetical protein